MPVAQMRGVGTQRANKSKVTFSEKDEVEEYNPADPAAAAPPAEDPTRASSAPKRGRPPKPVEDLTPLEQAEKRMKTAVHKYQEEKFALLKKVGDLKGELAWMDHPSTVAHLGQSGSNGSKMLSVLAQLFSRDSAANTQRGTFLPAPQIPLLAVSKSDPKSVSCAFHLPGRCCPSVTIFTGQLLGTAPRSPVRDHAVGGCSNRSDSNAHVAHLALPATFHAIPKVDSRRARRHTLTHRASMALALLSF